ncbi:MAG: hypothetical protein KDA37_04515, partial [Planctomycetales bacterium]|nr:hypothetical protein [Planctomycetales bacterium]
CSRGTCQGKNICKNQAMGPRFTIRAALYALTGMAFFSLVLAQAVRGNPWGVGAVALVVFLLAAFVPYAAWYGVVRLFGLLLGPTPLEANSASQAQHEQKEA